MVQTVLQTVADSSAANHRVHQLVERCERNDDIHFYLLLIMLSQGGYGKDTVRPLTIKQILDAEQPHPDADFKVDGENISQVRLKMMNLLMALPDLV